VILIKKKDQFLKNVKVELSKFEKWIGKGSKWLAGENFTFVDIMLYDALDQHLCLDSSILDSFKELSKFHQKVGDLENIKKFRNDKRCILRPLNNKIGVFK